MDKEREDQCEWIRKERINVSVHRISKSNCNKQGEGGKAAASTTVCAGLHARPNAWAFAGNSEKGSTLGFDILQTPNIDHAKVTKSMLVRADLT